MRLGKHVRIFISIWQKQGYVWLLLRGNISMLWIILCHLWFSISVTINKFTPNHQDYETTIWYLLLYMTETHNFRSMLALCTIAIVQCCRMLYIWKHYMNLPASSHLHGTATVVSKRQNSYYFITSEIMKKMNWQHFMSYNTFILVAAAFWTND
jgi:hypothetical protein